MFAIGRVGHFVNCRGAKPTRVTAYGTDAAGVLSAHVGSTGHDAS